jgi:hypothetical protein
MKYIKPEIFLIRLQHQELLMQSVKSLGTNLGSDDLELGFGGNGDARIKEQGGIWDEEW